MSKNPSAQNDPAEYISFLSDLKAKIREAGYRSSLAVNRELVLLYWHIGREILARQEGEDWGAKIIERLSADLRRNFPEMTGLSARNLKYMQTFTEAYPDAEFLQQVVAVRSG
jgi:predicted nuclease of restriction endonuclease-like (RecB) superfamily